MATKEKVSREQEEKDNIKKMALYLKENVEDIKNTTKEVRHLWGRCYRINFWGKTKIKEKVQKKHIIEEKTIVSSQFVIVDEVADGFVHRVEE